MQAPAEDGEGEGGAEEDDDGESKKGSGSEGGEGDGADDEAVLPSEDALFGERPGDT